jgi:hypothetical protein
MQIRWLLWRPLAPQRVWLCTGVGLVPRPGQGPRTPLGVRVPLHSLPMGMIRAAYPLKVRERQHRCRCWPRQHLFPPVERWWGRVARALLSQAQAQAQAQGTCPVIHCRQPPSHHRLPQHRQCQSLALQLQLQLPLLVLLPQALPLPLSLPLQLVWAPGVPWALPPR